MNSNDSIPVVDALSWTLIHFIWQGAAVALLLFLLKAILKRGSSALRYAVSCAAMLAMLVLPIITFAILYSDPNYANASPGLSPAQSKVENRYSVMSDLADDPLLSRTERAAEASSKWDLRVITSRLAPWLTSLWLAGVILLSLRMLGGWLYAQRLKSYLSQPLSEEWHHRFAQLCHEIRVLRPVRILESALVRVPTVIGWLRPVVLIPASALVGLTPRQLEAVIAHELAHIRRYDYLFNLLQTAVEILLFYHPAVWWVSREIRDERELCCDDVAVSVCGDPILYARALTEIETLRSVSPQLAMAADGGSLLARIQRLIGAPPRRVEQPTSWAAGAIVFTLVFGLAASVQLLSADTQGGDPETLGEKPPALARADTSTAEPVRADEPNAEPEEKQPTETLSSADVDSPDDTAADEPAEALEPSQPQGSSFVEELAALGYSNLSIDDLLALRNNGVTPQLIRELKVQGLEKLSVTQLTRLGSTGITGKFIQELKAAGLEKLGVQSLIRLTNNGVNTALIRELNSLGYKNLSTDELSRVSSHGVTPAFIRELESAGYTGLSVEELVHARDHGVTSDFIKDIRNRGYDGMTLKQVIRLIDHGVNSAFIQSMEAGGFGRLSLEDLVRARDHGVNAEFAQRVVAAGYPNSSLDQLIRMRDHGVTIDFIDSIRKAGYDNLTIDQLVRMRDHGVNAEFIRSAKSQGFQNLSIDQLIRLRDSGVIN
jgi:beta-lactamase regulating signal transducer with metallopeptidase domain